MLVSNCQLTIVLKFFDLINFLGLACCVHVIWTWLARIWIQLWFAICSDRHYAAFCLLHLGSTVCDTSLLFDIDRKTTELSFDDVITL